MTAPVAAPAIAVARAVGATKIYGSRRHAGARARRRHRRLRRRPLHRHHGPVGLRQVDADALRRRPRLAHVGPGVHRRRRPRHAVRQGAHRAPARAGRLRVPVVQPAADAQRRGEHHAAHRPRRRQARRGVARRGRAHRRPRRPAPPPAVGALRRPAAAGRRGPGPGQQAGDHLRRRAHRQPRLADERRDPRLHAPRRARAGPDDRDGHPRPGGGGLRRPRPVPRRRADRRRDARADGREGPRPPQAARATT